MELEEFKKHLSVNDMSASANVSPDALLSSPVHHAEDHLWGQVTIGSS